MAEVAGRIAYDNRISQRRSSTRLVSGLVTGAKRLASDRIRHRIDRQRHHGSPGGRKSVELLTRTVYAKWFYGAIWVIGIVLPAVLLMLPVGFGSIVIAALGMLIGFYAFRVLIFKAGVFEPIMSFKP